MENREHHQGLSSEYTLDYFVRLPETKHMIEAVEAEINEYLDTFNFDPYTTPSDFLDEKIEELDSCLNVPYEQNCTAIGKAYFGDELEIHPDENASHLSESNSGLVSLKGVDFCGFEFRNIPGTLEYKAMLMCIEPVELSEDSPNPEVKAYYFLPEDIVSIIPNNHVDIEAFRDLLGIHTSRSKEALENFSMFSAKKQHQLLEKLSYDAAVDVMAMYGDDELHIDADLFYRIEYDNNYGAEIELVDRREEYTSGKLVEMPVGVVQGCAFVESIIYHTDKSRRKKLTDLLEYEPCIVLTDDSLVPIYLVPLSQFKDALILNSRQDQQ